MHPVYSIILVEQLIPGRGPAISSILQLALKFLKQRKLRMENSTSAILKPTRVKVAICTAAART
jgi:hypothetical protein